MIPRRIAGLVRSILSSRVVQTCCVVDFTVHVLHPAPPTGGGVSFTKHDPGLKLASSACNSVSHFSRRSGTGPKMGSCQLTKFFFWHARNKSLAGSNKDLCKSGPIP